MSKSRLQPGTLCLISAAAADHSPTAHDGKIVHVAYYVRNARIRGSYVCNPDLRDPADGRLLAWPRDCLVPLPGGDGLDEMLRITGKPGKIRKPKRKADLVTKEGDTP